MPKVRLELTQDCSYRILSPARLPIPPLGPGDILPGEEPTEEGSLTQGVNLQNPGTLAECPGALISN